MIRRIALALLATGCCCGASRSDADLEPEDRDVGAIEGGATVSAHLEGHYVREHHGGGRFGWTTLGEEERWLLRVGVDGGDAPVTNLVPDAHDGWVVWRGDARDAGVERLEGLRVESCAVPDGAVFRVTGGEDGAPWQALRAGDGWRFVARFATDAERCAVAATALSPVATHLRDVWEDGLRAWHEHMTTAYGQAMSADRGARMRAGLRACDVLIDRDEAREALRCHWAMRIPVNRSTSDGARLIELVEAGPSNEPDYEAAMVELLTLDELPPPSDAALTDQMRDHHRYALPTWLGLMRTPERMRAYVEHAIASCRAGWCLAGSGAVAHRLGDDEACGRLLDAFGEVVGTEEGDAVGALEGAKRVWGCGDEARFRALMLAGLGRPSVPGGPAGGACRPGAIIEGTFGSTVCHSLPRYAGSWLATRCGDDAVERARAIAAERRAAGVEALDDERLDGAERVLASCAPPPAEEAPAGEVTE